MNDWASWSEGWARSVVGMEQSYANAPEAWRKAARYAVFKTACELRLFTADDVWDRFPAGYTKWDGNALGHIMRQGRAKGWMKPTGETWRSRRPVAHCKPLPVWLSLIYVEDLEDL